MTYAEPEVEVLGYAGSLIENQVPPKLGVCIDAYPILRLITPAYDLDE